MKIGTKVEMYDKSNFVNFVGIGTVIDYDILDVNGDPLDIDMIKLNNGSVVWSTDYDIIPL